MRPLGVKAREVVRRVVRVLRDSPMTVTFLVVFWLVGAVTGSLVLGPVDAVTDVLGSGVVPLAVGQWWTPLTSAAFSLDLMGYLGTSLLVLLVGPLAERRLGPLRAAGAFLTTQVVGTLVGLGAVQLGALAGHPWFQALHDEVTFGPSLGVVGLAMATSRDLSARWRRRLRLLGVFGLLVFALYSGYLQDVLRLASGLIGLAVGRLFVPGPRAAWAWKSSTAETRLLMALAIAASAAGPLVALLGQFGQGPFSIFQWLFIAERPDPDMIAEACAESASNPDCLLVHAQAAYDWVPSVVVGLLPVWVLLVLAEGLRRGRRLAWWAAVAANGATAVYTTWLALAVSGDKDVSVDAWLAFDLVSVIALPMALLVWLLLVRRSFREPSPGVRRFWVATAVLLVVLFAVYCGLGWVVRDQFAPAATLGALALDFPTRLLPLVLLDLAPLRFLPIGSVGSVLFEWTGVVFWAVAVAGLLTLFWRARPDPDEEGRQRARDLLTRHGGDNLSWLTTWQGNHYWFDSTGTAAIAYRVGSMVALTTTDPIGDPAARTAALTEFAGFCADRGWTPCLYSVTAGTRDAAHALGWQSVQVAEDTVVDLATLKFTGKKWQDIRTALNRAGKEGITAEWHSYADAPLAITDQVRSISEEWVADKGLPEMGFTLGGLPELADPAVRCLIAVDADRTVHGITSWMPVYRSGEVVGWTLDFMRRRAVGFKGVMEFLIASAAQRFQEEGAEFMSLSGAPLARLDRGEQPTTLQKLLDVTGRTVEPVYGFQSLFAFKAKFQPRYEPMYMCYPDATALPRVANSISRAYLPDLDTRQGFRLVRKLISS